MAQFIDQLFCPNMRGLLIVKIRLREVAGSIPDELRFFIIIFSCICLLFSILYRTWRSDCGRVAGSNPDKLRFFYYFGIVQDSCICLDPIAGGSRDRFPKSSDFLLFCTVQGSCICLPYELGKYIYGTPRTEDRIPDSWDSRILGIAGKVAGSIPDELRNEYYYFRTVEPVHLGYVHLLFTTFSVQPANIV